MTNQPDDTHKTACLPIVRSTMFGHVIADAMGVMFDMGITTSRAFVDLLEMDKELTE